MRPEAYIRVVRVLRRKRLNETVHTRGDGCAYQSAPVRLAKSGKDGKLNSSDLDNYVPRDGQFESDWKNG